MGAEVANLTPADVKRIIGSIEDHDIARVVGTGASAADLADAIACMQAGSYVAGTGPIKLTPAGEQSPADLARAADGARAFVT